MARITDLGINAIPGMNWPFQDNILTNCGHTDQTGCGDTDRPQLTAGGLSPASILQLTQQLHDRIANI